MQVASVPPVEVPFSYEAAVDAEQAASVKAQQGPFHKPNSQSRPQQPAAAEAVSEAQHAADVKVAPETNEEVDLIDAQDKKHAALVSWAHRISGQVHRTSEAMCTAVTSACQTLWAPSIRCQGFT